MKSQDAIDTHLESDDIYDIEIRLQTKSGAYRWFRTCGAAIKDTEGRPVRMSGSLIDISDRKQAEKDRQHASGYLHPSYLPDVKPFWGNVRIFFTPISENPSLTPFKALVTVKITCRNVLNQPLHHRDSVSPIKITRLVQTV